MEYAEFLKWKIARAVDSITDVGLGEKDLHTKVIAAYQGKGSVLLDKKIGEIGARVNLIVSTALDGGPDFAGYELLLPKAHGPIEHFVYHGVDTGQIEKAFSVIDYSQIKVEEYQGYLEPTGNINYDHLQLAMDSLAEMYEKWELSPQMEMQLNDLRNGLYVKYGAGNAFEQHLLRYHGMGWLKGFYQGFLFPNHLHIGLVEKSLIDNRLGELAELAWSSGPKTREIMNASNLEQLKSEMTRLSFSENLIGQMEAHMSRNEPKFILYDELESDKGRLELALHFNQSKTSEYYYFNKFDLVRETQPPLAPGEKYFVSSQRQGEEVILKEFEMPSLAVKEFNMRLEASKDIRGAAQLYAGASLQDSKELATMGDGKLIEIDKDFYKTLKNPAPGQTFYLEKGNGFTLSQAMNLLSGRSVYREDMLNVQKNEYTAWAKLDFDEGREKSGNYPVKTFSEGYGYDLSAVLDRFDLLDLKDAASREKLEASLKNGDMAPAIVEINGKKEAILVVAVPEFKQLNLYSVEGKSIKREEHLKEEKIAEVGVGKDKNVKKGKEQEEGMSV